MLVLPERERTKKGAIGVETKGVTCKIPLDLHNQISEEIRETESTMSKFIEMIIREHYEKGANRIMEKGRTLAFQVSEELFQRVKEYLENYEKAYHRRLTQKEFVIGLIEEALEELEAEMEKESQESEVPAGQEGAKSGDEEEELDEEETEDMSGESGDPEEWDESETPAEQNGAKSWDQEEPAGEEEEDYIVENNWDETEDGEDEDGTQETDIEDQDEETGTDNANEPDELSDTEEICI